MINSIKCLFKGPATRNDFVNDIVNDARADAIFATLKAIVDGEKSTISSTISLRVAWPLVCKNTNSTFLSNADVISSVNSNRANEV